MNKYVKRALALLCTLTLVLSLSTVFASAADDEKEEFQPKAASYFRVPLPAKVYDNSSLSGTGILPVCKNGQYIYII